VLGQGIALVAKIEASAVGCTELKQLVSRKYLDSGGINSPGARIFAEPRIPRLEQQISDRFICLVAGMSQ
jgi:hypothetical protein